ncbi:MAG: Pvc16 family protein [Cyanobacteria bacterium J06629_18]
MSNHLAIATVTATIQRIVQAAVQEDIDGTVVTTARPDNQDGGTAQPRVNIYMYQATPNPAWRNSDLRTRRPKGELIKQAQAGLNLYYLMTFYGNDSELEPQRLLGSTLRTLVDQPILTPEMIQETINSSRYSSYLRDSNLAEQVERVSITPTKMNTEELSKIWSVFFQTPYILSFAWQGSAVLIEGAKSGKRLLPIRAREFYSQPNQPIISQLILEDNSNNRNLPDGNFEADSSIVIRGQNLNSELSDEKLGELEEQLKSSEKGIRDKARSQPFYRSKPEIKIGEAKITPQKVTDGEISLNLASLSKEERNLLRTGIQSLQIIYTLVPKRFPSEPTRIVSSNTVPFVLCPKVEKVVEVEKIEDSENGFYSALVKVRVDLVVGKGQKVLLFLNERSIFSPAAYIFSANSRSQDTNYLVFTVRDVKRGKYLARVQIDGAESLLSVGENQEYDSPAVIIGKSKLNPS